MSYFAFAVLYQNIPPNHFYVSLKKGDQVTPGSICLTLAAQLLSLGESYLACDLGLRSNVGSLNVSDNTSHPGTQPARRLT